MNQLLASLPEAERALMLSRTLRIPLENGETIYEPAGLIERLYFPDECILSMLQEVDGTAVEVGMIGNEGMAGLPVFLGTDRPFSRVICQLPGSAMQIEAPAFRDLLPRLPVFQDLLHRYTHYLLIQSAQSTVCNRLHTAEQRMCRWLLMTRDRATSDHFPLRQDFMAKMLGVQRPTVSLVASHLQKAELIRYRRGHMTILQRDGLLARCCECYAKVADELQRVFAP
jgi:CRP-like cAMP-binding protein